MPLSDDPAKRERQLSNLPNMRGEMPAGAWKAGHGSPRYAGGFVHGMRTVKPGPLLKGQAMSEIVGALAAMVPGFGDDGEVPLQFVPPLETAALKLVRVRRGMTRLIGNETDERGRWRRENADLDRAIESYERSLYRLARLVIEYARLELDVGRDRRDVASWMARETSRETVGVERREED